jgi:flagellar basal-body rod protein FlgF
MRCLANGDMNVSLYQAAAALNANSRWQDVISQNLAASAIPGYKKQELSFSAVQSSQLNALSPSARTLMPQVVTATNFQQGTLRPTGEQTDLAIEGAGFFEVQLPDGSRGYTRDGEFRVNAQNQLVTKQGYMVLGDGGPIQLDPNNGGPLSVAPSGDLSQGAEAKGRLKVVQFSDPNRLTAVGNGFFQSHDPTLLPTEATGTIRQGFLENANTSPVTEMAGLVNAMRIFEANQKVMQLHDERMGKAISELGSPS